MAKRKRKPQPKKEKPLDFFDMFNALTPELQGKVRAYNYAASLKLMPKPTTFGELTGRNDHLDLIKKLKRGA